MTRAGTRPAPPAPDAALSDDAQEWLSLLAILTATNAALTEIFERDPMTLDTDQAVDALPRSREILAHRLTEVLDAQMEKARSILDQACTDTFAQKRLVELLVDACAHRVFCQTVILAYGLTISTEMLRRLRALWEIQEEIARRFEMFVDFADPFSPMHVELWLYRLASEHPVAFGRTYLADDRMKIFFYDLALYAKKGNEQRAREYIAQLIRTVCEAHSEPTADNAARPSKKRGRPPKR